MDLVRQGSTEKHDNQRITVAEFDDDNKFFWLGTDKGLLICISVETGEEIGEAYNLCAELPKPITRIRKFVGVDTENLFLVVLNRSEALLYSHERRTHNRVTYGESEEEKSYEGKLICNARVAYNSKFFCIGLPQHRALGFFAFNRKELTSRPVKWLTKVSAPFAGNRACAVRLLGLLHGPPPVAADVPGRGAQDARPPRRAVGLRLEQTRRQAPAQNR